MVRRSLHSLRLSARLVLVPIGVLLIAGCAPAPAGSPTSATASPHPAATATTPAMKTTGVPRFVPDVCSFDTTPTPGVGVDCGFVVVPAHHADPTGPTIRLAVARFRSRASRPAVDPVIYLAGGPGGPGLLARVTAQIASDFTPMRDFIAFDQRGVGHSDPALACPELAQQTRTELLLNEGATDELAHEVAARFRCRDRLRGAGIDLAAYTTTESAADVDDIRVVLGYGAMDLLGASYGTRLALTVLRDFPGSVRSAVLDSVSPPQADTVEDLASDADRALNLALAGCVASGACTEDVATLRADFERDVTTLNAHPLSWPDVVLTGDRFSSQIVALLGSQALIGTVPALIEAAKRGDEDYLFNALVAYTSIGTGGNSTGMGTSVACASDVPFNSRARTIAAAQTTQTGSRASQLPLALSYFDLCAGWPSAPPDPRDHRAVVSDVPTLILASANDPATPPAYGQLAAQTLSRSFYVETPGIGHTVMGTACGRAMIARFVTDPTHEPDTACIGQLGITYASTA